MEVDVNKELSEIRESRAELEEKSQILMHLAKREEELQKLRMTRDSIKMQVADLERVLTNDDLSKVRRKETELRIAEHHERLARVEVDLKVVEKEVAEINATVARKKHFDKYLLFQNVRELLKKKAEVKLGQIEKEAGCQPGYMSRLDKPGNATDPTAEFIVTASQLLGVSVDTLLNVPVQELTSTELFIISLLEKMIRDTDADKLTWVRQPASALKEIGLDEQGDVEHELYVDKVTMETFGTEYPEPTHHVFFPSRAFDANTEIADDGFFIRMKNGTRMYLMSVCEKEADSFDFDKFCTEIWMVQNGADASYLCSSNDHPGIAKLVEKLYRAVAQNVKHPKVKENYRYILDAYMNDDLEDDPAEPNIPRTSF